jgi:class 3 adenylate cyclase/predicted ATPase
MDVGGWLRSLGLGQYEASFRDNKIDVDVLADLDDGDLEKLGLPLGDRKRLLKAIAGLAPRDTSAAPPPAAARASSPKPLPRAELAERRPITVMFCDLVGSTSLAARLDAEDWRNLVNAYLDAASAAVTALGGHVLKRLGDGLMALFGYPQAQENDAERAVRAALAIQRALADLNARNAVSGAPELKARIGIESGPAVVEANGEVFGDAPNVAARVEAAAEPGSVLVTTNVHRQIAGLFVAEDEGTRELKGVSAPVQLFGIVRASGGGRRGGARALTQFVGREEELAMLARRWERAYGAEGQLALIVGEPGLGKSRLIEEFRARLKETPHTWVEWSASQLLQNTPLHPIVEWGRLRFGADAPAGERLVDLEGTLRLIGLDPAEHAPLLAPLVDIPLPPARAANFPPEELRKRQMAAMTAWILAGARSQPIVLAFEDLHWADPTSLDLLRALAERGAQAPLLILATTRPEFRPPWSLRSHHSVISLAPLDRAGVARMVEEISAHHALSKEVIEGVNARTGGVPLFVEEVTRLLLERGVEGGVQAIPLTLQQSLAARLDRLGPAREIAQIGAVLGREFGYGLLHAVAAVDDRGGLSEAALQSALDRLADADLLVVEGAPPQASFRFKHALVQDAAYDSLLKSRRQALHRRAAELLRDDPERAAAEPELVAHHFTEAGLDDLAIEWWGKAGDQALRRSAFQEAIAHLGKAIAMADKAGGVSSQGQKLHVAYGNALIAARGHGARETAEAFARARDSTFGDGHTPERLAADYGLWAGSCVRGELSPMRAYAETFLSDVAATSDSPEASVAHRAAGMTHWFAGEYREAREHLERALALFQPGRDDDLAFRFGQDQGVSTMVYLALTLWPLGDVERAASLVRGAEARSAGLAHIGTRVYGKSFAAIFELMRGDFSRAASNAAVLARLTGEHDLPMWLAFGVFLEGLATAQSGPAGGGLENMRRGVELMRKQNVLIYDGLFKIALAEAEARAGDVDRAIAVLDEALATSERTGHRAFEAELHRVRGEMLVKRDPANPAAPEEALLTAVAVAKQQSARSFELRAALALAKLYQSTARPADAHAVLAPVLKGFSPTPEMPEIAEAQALLAALAETEEVKAAEAQRQQRLHLQTAYGQAMMWSKGFVAEETRAAFARADELAVKTGSNAERNAIYFARWVSSHVSGELNSARKIAESFLREAEAEGSALEAAVARRALGWTCLFQGELALARSHVERVLADHARERNMDASPMFGFDNKVTAKKDLALSVWLLGDAEFARRLIEQTDQEGQELRQIANIANVTAYTALLEAYRDDPAATRRVAGEALRFAKERDMAFFAALGEILSSWARGRLGDPEAGLSELRRALTAYLEQGYRAVAPCFYGLVGELEAMIGHLDLALESVDTGLAIADKTGERWTDPFLFRRKGEILLERDTANPHPAEAAFRTAIVIAQRQGSRSFCLRAALSLAKLLQSTGRPVDAHAVLAPALDGFAPTPEMPEIAEAQALMERLA